MATNGGLEEQISYKYAYTNSEPAVVVFSRSCETCSLCCNQCSFGRPAVPNANVFSDTVKVTESLF